MDPTLAMWARLFGVSMVYGVLLAVVLSPLLVLVYRRRVGRWMDQPARGERAPPQAAPGEPAQPAETPAPVLWRRLALDAVPAAPSSPHNRQRRRVTRRLIAGWCAGGSVNAAWLTWLLLEAYPQYASPGLALTGFATFVMPVLATALVLADLRMRARVLLFVGAGVLLYLLLGQRGGLAFTLFQAFVLLPVALLLLLGLRFWRGVAPLVMPLALASGALAVAAVEAARQVFGVGVESVWPWRLLGFAAGAVLGGFLLRLVQAGYERRRLSDQEMFLDAWWLLYVMIQTVVLVLMKRDTGYFIALLGWPLAIAARRLVWRWLPVAPAGIAGSAAGSHGDDGTDATDATDRPRHLLLLRVFDDSGRAHRLFERVEQRWRTLGGIYMIAGRDLALRNLSPADFVAFVSGRLRQRFVGDGKALATRLQALRDQRDADGRFRVEHFWCHADAWRPVMRALAQRSAVVLMDLRGFAPQREGSRYELLHLARTAADRRVVLLVDDSTQQQALRDLLDANESDASNWRVAELGPAGAEAGDRLFNLLAEAPAGVR